MTRRRPWVWTPAVALAATIAWLSHQPTWPEPLTGWPDELLHALAFGALAVSVFYGLSDGGRRCRRDLLPPAALAAWLYGAVDEWHQSFVPGRDAAVGDWLADGVGALLGAVALAVVSFAGLWGVWED